MNIYDFRPVPFYFINTVDPEDLRRTAIMKSMKKLKRNGFGGCVVFNKPPDGFSQEEYLSDKWFEMVENFALAGRELKMQVWINDGFDFPPGDAGGRIQKLAPSLKQRRLAAVGENGFEIREVEWGFRAFEEP
jgi:predicted metal-dependent TIM-barrel fold hydrolase